MGLSGLSTDFDKAKTHALKFLSYRDHGGGELLAKLGIHYEPETAQKALEWLRELGYQDDRRYAEKLAALLIETKHYGMRKARYELKAKGLPAEIIDDVLDEYYPEDVIDILTELIERKYADKLDDNDYSGVKKTVDALMRRGYDYGDIKTAISRVKEDLELEDDG